MKTPLFATLLLSLAAPTSNAQESPFDIVGTLVRIPGFEALVGAVGDAGLVDALQGEGPLTVFAPTDEAFAKLPRPVINALANDPELLGAILQYHVVAAEVFAAQAADLTSAETLIGQSVSISTGMNGELFINDSLVTFADIQTTNGIIHVIDTVLIPDLPQLGFQFPIPVDLTAFDIVGALGLSDQFSTLITAAVAAELADDLQGAGPFTLLAPTNRAFANLPEGTLESLLNDPAALADILLYHIIPGEFFQSEVLGLTEAPTLLGPTVQISVIGSGAFINDSQLLQTNVDVSNGVIHSIDAVLLPPGS